MFILICLNIVSNNLNIIHLNLKFFFFWKSNIISNNNKILLFIIFTFHYLNIWVFKLTYCKGFTPSLVKHGYLRSSLHVLSRPLVYTFIFDSYDFILYKIHEYILCIISYMYLYFLISLSTLKVPII
jgi:hypothetical protein